MRVLIIAASGLVGGSAMMRVIAANSRAEFDAAPVRPVRDELREMNESLSVTTR